MINESNISEQNILKGIENELTAIKINQLITKAKIDEEMNDDEVYSFYNISASIFKSQLALMFKLLIASLRFMLLFVFSNNNGIHFTTGVSAILPIYSIFSANVPFATTQYMSYQAGYFYGKKEFRNLGLIVNKSFLYNFYVSIIIFLSFFFIVPPIFASFFNYKETIDVIYGISRLMSLSIPLQYSLTVLTYYFLATKQYKYVPGGQMIGFPVQIIMQCIIILGLKNHIMGIGISYGIGQTAALFTMMYIYGFKNNSKESYVSIKFDETNDNFWKYVKTSLPVGLIVFLNLISIELFQFMSILLGDYIFTAHSLLTSFLSLLLTFSKALSTANNVEINRAIGANKYKYYKKIILSSLLITTLYSIIMCLILVFFLKHIMKLYSTDETTLDFINSLKIPFSLVFFTNSYIFLFSESLSCFGNNKVPLMNLLLFRFIGTISLGLMFFSLEVGLNSFLLSFVINNFCMILINSYYLNIAIDEAIIKSKKC